MLNFFQWHNGINLMNAKAPPQGAPQVCSEPPRHVIPETRGG